MAYEYSSGATMTAAGSDAGASGGVLTELRVHGVSGTSPEALLHCPAELLQEVSVDNGAGIYTPRESVPSEGAEGRLRRVLEAYSWGALTSGPASRAIWLLVLPFVLINLAHWMLPPARAHSGPSWWASRVSPVLLRMLALSLTLTLMLAVTQIAVDVVGWQCAAMPHCAARLGPLRFLHDRSAGVSLMCTAIPVAILPLLLLMFGRDHPAPADAARTPPPAAVSRENVRLEEPDFWVGDESLVRLRRCHVTTWMSGLGFVILYPGSANDAAAVSKWLMWINAAVFIIAVAAVVWTRLTGRGGSGARWATAPLTLLQWLSITVLVASLVGAARGGAARDAAVPNDLPGLRFEIYSLVLAQAALVVLLFVSSAVSLCGSRAGRGGSGKLRRRHKAFRPTLCGFTAVCVAAIAWLVGGGFSAGAGLWVAQYLGNPVPAPEMAKCEIDITAAVTGGARGLPAACGGVWHSKMPDPVTFEDQVHFVNFDAPLLVPAPYFWAATAFVGLFVALMLAMVVLVGAVASRRRKAVGVVCDDYPDLASPSDADAADYRIGRERAIASGRAWATVPDMIPGVLATLTALALVAFAVVLVLYGRSERDLLYHHLANLTNACVLVISLAAAGIVALAAWAYRNQQARRTVGILWDVITFWPRANHPLTPPSYGSQVVHDLSAQIDDLTDEPQHSVVVCAHSQGSIIAAATLLKLGHRGGNRHTALLTFGAPLRRLYARNFPAYFGFAALNRLREVQTGRWINLWALSDPIGGWVFNDENLSVPAGLRLVDCRLPDAQGLDPGPRQLRYPVCAHSGFWSRPEYEAAIDTLQPRLINR
ncbi:MAG: hypothetical protein QOJ56_2371 [Mycobacterium sp.]|nr:hypothetical protein [Mycobacterium sp.]